MKLRIRIKYREPNSVFIKQKAITVELPDESTIINIAGVRP